MALGKCRLRRLVVGHVDEKIADVGATLLYSLGLDVPSDFEGVVRNNTKGRATKFLDYECYEPMAVKDSEPQSGSWSRTDAGDTTSPYSRWSETSTWKSKQCYNAYVNDGDSNPSNCIGHSAASNGRAFATSLC